MEDLGSPQNTANLLRECSPVNILNNKLVEFLQ